MFWFIFYIFSLFLVYAGFASYFSQRRQNVEVLKAEQSKLAVIAILPFFCLAVLVINILEFSGDIKVLIMTAGSALTILTLYLSSKSKYRFKSN